MKEIDKLLGIPIFLDDRVPRAMVLIMSSAEHRAYEEMVKNLPPDATLLEVPVNIDDVKDIPDVITVDTVFAEQRRLSEKYAQIERRPEHINFDTREGQQLIKDFLWRIAEEVGEALDSPLGISHQKEELADALHFLIELCIITGYEEKAKDIFELEAFESTRTNSALDYQNIYHKLHNLLIDLAKVGRTCKNKPWKQTQIPMDQREYHSCLIRLIITYKSFCSEFFQSSAEMYQFYFKKAQVNTFRQRSGY